MTETLYTLLQNDILYRQDDTNVTRTLSKNETSLPSTGSPAWAAFTILARK